MVERKLMSLLAILVLTVVAAPMTLAEDHPQNVILFGWDGAQRDHVNECLARGELPNLQKLIDQGKYVEIDIEGKTDTKAGWAQILTGYYPEVTGVYSNGIYQPVPKDLSLFERLEKRFGPDDFVTVAVIGKRGHCGAIDPPKKIRLDAEPGQGTEEPADPGAGTKPKGKIIEEDGVKYRFIPGSPYYNMYTALEVWEFGLSQDRKVGTRALELLEKYRDKPFFFFVHFAEVDQAGHKHGENSREYNDALISNDLWTGKIIDKVKQLGLGGKTQFYVTADHGFNEDKTGHSFAPHVFLATNNKNVSRNGRRQDVAPTILEAFGFDVGTLEPPLDGISLTKPDARPPAKIQPFRARQVLRKMRRPDILYVPTPQDVVEKMLEMVEVTKDDLVYDLGCGDGRIVVTAAKNYGCKAVGYDIDPKRVRESRENVRKNNVGHLVRIEQEDIFTLDLSRANVITLYLLPSLNVKLIPQLDKLKPGSRIVSHDFAMQGVKPEQVVEMDSEQDSREHTIYMWRTPLNKTTEE